MRYGTHLSSWRYWLAKVAMASLRSQSFTRLCSNAKASALSTRCMACLWALSCTHAQTSTEDMLHGMHVGLVLHTRTGINRTHAAWHACGPCPTHKHRHQQNTCCMARLWALSYTHTHRNQQNTCCTARLWALSYTHTHRHQQNTCCMARLWALSYTHTHRNQQNTCCTARLWALSCTHAQTCALRTCCMACLR